MTTGEWPRGDEPEIVLSTGDTDRVIDMDALPDDRQLRLPWRRVATVAALLAAAAGGYLVGRADHPPAAVPVASQPTPPPLRRSHVLAPTGDSCAVATRSTVQVGASITNFSDDPVTVSSVDVTLPMGGLTLRQQAWGTCGHTVRGGGSQVVGPGEIVWFTATFGLPDGCPAPYPVMFTVSSLVDGATVQTPVDEFPDLGNVDFPTC